MRAEETIRRALRVCVGLLCGLVPWGSICVAGDATEPPRRLVSICAQGDQLLLELVDRSRILAVSKLASDPDISPHWKEAQNVPTTDASAEAIVRLKPDLVLAGKYSTPQTVRMLKRLGVPVLELDIANDFDELRAQIREVAKTLGADQKAETLIKEMDARLQRVRETTPPQRPTAMFYFHDGFTPGGHTFPNAILEAAGFRNLGAEFSKEMGVNTSLESVVMTQPQFLFLTKYRQDHPTVTQICVSQVILKQISQKMDVVAVSFRHLATPDPLNLELVEMLHEELLRHLPVGGGKKLVQH